ncbi:hypothetical protein CMALT430_110070 [Carnobacterium maltaromaticum]|nr:hypothetical protein CMALT430_110070 [Carnobacterium maltaromaticum]
MNHLIKVTHLLPCKDINYNCVNRDLANYTSVIYLHFLKKSQQLNAREFSFMLA